MGFWKETIRRAAFLRRRSQFDEELEQEISLHLEMRASELEQLGMTRTAAMAQARREFGNNTSVREQARSAWQVRWIEDLAADLRYAARAFRRNPAFAATAVACLALGIGANTTIFSIAMEVLFSEPSVRDPQSLARVWVGGNSATPVQEWRFLRETHPIGEIAGANAEEEMNWSEGGRTLRLYAVRVTDNFFRVAGVPLAMGRAAGPEDPTGLVISHAFWQRRLGGDAGVVGRKLVLDGRPYAVAGVLPRNHRTVTGFGLAPDLYVPVSDEHMGVDLVARLPAGMSHAEARSRLAAACAEYDRTHPSEHERWAAGIRVKPISGIARLRGEIELASIAAFFAMLMVVVGLVLAIACANVASLLMARAASRAHEMAVRLSIGAGRWRMVRQLLAESLLLAVCGTVAGLALNWVLTRAISGMTLPITFPIRFVIEPDWRLAGYSALVACAVTLAAGLAPALSATRSGIGAVLQRGQRGTPRARLRSVLVAAQLAVSVVLLCAALLFLRNLWAASSLHPGFDADHTVWSFMRLVPERYPKALQVRGVADRAMEKLRNVPGVEAVALARVVPLNHPMTQGSTVRPDNATRKIHVSFHPNYVTPDYFRAMGIPLVRGRAFTAADRQGAPRVAILNENLARGIFGNTDAVGHTVNFDNGITITIVGIAANGKYFTLGEEDPRAWFEPYAQWRGWNPNLHLMIRTPGRPREVIAAIDRALAEVDPTAAVDSRPMRCALGMAMLPSQVGAVLLGAMGALGLAMAAIGLYGSLLYAVSRRVREIGVRMALGATAGRVLAMVLRQSLGMMVAGLGVGLAIAFFAVRPLAMFLIPEVRTGDPGNFAIVGAALLLVGLAATLSPALRATRVDPVTALRWE